MSEEGWGRKAIDSTLSNQGALGNQALAQAFPFIIRFVTPVLVLLILLRGLKIL